MKTDHRELRLRSVISAGISLLLVLFSSVGFASKMAVWSGLATETKMLWAFTLSGAVALLVSSILHAATEKKWIGVWHGLLMTFVALVIFSYAFRGIYDLEKHPRGGFVEMGAIPIYGGMVLLALVTAGSAALTLIHVTEKKPNQAVQTTPGLTSNVRREER